MSKWVRVDRRYNQPYRLTGYAVRSIFKWTALVLAWVFANVALASAHAGYLILFTTAGLGWYAIRRAQAGRAVALPPRPAPGPSSAPSRDEVESCPRLAGAAPGLVPAAGLAASRVLAPAAGRVGVVGDRR